MAHSEQSQSKRLVGPGGTAYEVTLQLASEDPVRVDILREWLSSLGIEPYDIIELTKQRKTSLSFYVSSLAKAGAIRQRIAAKRLKGVKVTSRALPKDAWQTKWKKDFKPFRLTPTCTVIPMWDKDRTRVRTSRRIYMDTTTAFGTGLHATTRFMAGFIERYTGRLPRFLDVGTGTGILAIIALQCGAEHVDAFDISADAVKVARENMVVNGFPDQKITLGNIFRWRKKRAYDYVAANLVTEDLVRCGTTLVGLVRPGGYLAVSGISWHNYAHFREVFRRFPLRCVKVEKGEGWTAILFKKKP